MHQAQHSLATELSKSFQLDTIRKKYRCTYLKVSDAQQPLFNTMFAY